MSVLRRYRWDIVITLVVATAILYWMGVVSLMQFITLAILEISLSFDNAVVNALVLKRMSHGWQRAFVLVGIWIAVFGMRALFPIAIVYFTTNLGFIQVATLSVTDTATYAHHLEAAHPEIAALGGVYLGMIFLTFFLGEDNEIPWIKPIEHALAKVSRPNLPLGRFRFIGGATFISGIIMATVLGVVSFVIGGDEGMRVFVAGAIALGLFLGVQAFGSLFEHEDEEEAAGSAPVKTGLAGLGLFVYLEFQDAAFSFDGVSAAFAITPNVFLIAAGLGVAAFFVRSMTVHFVESGQLDNLPYLGSGAHWAIGILSVSIVASLFVHVPEWVTGPVCAAFIIAAWIHSKMETKRKLSVSAAPAVGAPQVSEA